MHTALTIIILNNSVRISLRSFLPFGISVLKWDRGVNKTWSPGKEVTTVCKNLYSFGYFCYVSYYRQIILAANYEFPTITSNQENNNNINREIFKGLSDKTLSLYIDEECDAIKINEVISILESTFPELMALL